MKKILFSSLSFLAPAVVFAVTSGTAGLNSNAALQGAPAFLAQLNQLISFIIPFIIGLGVLVIIYGVFGYVSSAGDEEKRKTAKDFIIWGIIGVFIMLSVWGLINILVNTFALNTTAAVPTNNPFTPALPN